MGRRDRVPRIGGSDLCGRVGALAGDPVAPPPGDPVGFAPIGSEFDGAIAGYCRVPARHLHDVRASPLSDVEIGAMPCTFGTALHPLTPARDAAPPHAALDAVIDVVGGPGRGAGIAALRRGGRYAVSGAVAGPVVEADLRTICLGDLTLLGCTFQAPEVFARLAQTIRDGAVRPVVSRVYPLREIAAAQADLAAGRYPGKLVLVAGQEGLGTR